MPTGWRPEDVKDKYPVRIITDVYHFERYQTPASVYMKGYAIFQMIFTLVLLLFMFYNYSEIGFDGLLLFGAFVFTGIYGYTSLMDRARYAFWIELIRAIAGLGLIYSTGDWFGINEYLSWGSAIVAIYFMITILAAYYFSFKEHATGIKMAL